MKRFLYSILTLMLLLGGSTTAFAQSMDHYQGDVNLDGEINIADINVVIDVILSETSYPSADVNLDGEINIADVNALIDIILNPPIRIPEDVHIFGETPASEGSVLLVTDNTVAVTCQPGEEPQPGEIIVSGVTDNAPYGFLRRVESVENYRGQCVMTTTNASLEEVLPDCDFHVSIPLAMAGQKSSIMGASQEPSRMTFSTELKGTVKVGWKNDIPDFKFDVWPFMTPEEEAKKEQEVLNGTDDSSYPLQFIAKLTPTLSLNFDGSVKHGKIQRLELSGELDVKAELLAKITLEKEFKLVGADGPHLFTVPLEPVTIIIYGVPVVFTPQIDVYLGMDFKGEMYMQFKLMSAQATGSVSYVYTREPNPATGHKHNFYKDFETQTLGDGDMEKRFQKWLAPKVGVKGSAKFSLDPIVNVSVYDANDIFNLGIPISPWVKTEGNLAITLNPDSPELDYDDQITIDGGIDLGVAAHFKLLGIEENWQKTFTLFETELFNPFGLTPRFDNLRVTPDEDPIPATTPAIGFDMYMTKPNLQLLPDQDYGFAYGPKDEPNRTGKWTFVSLKEQYDPGFDNDIYKRQHLEAFIDPSTVEPGVPYRVSPYVQLFGNIIYKKGENFSLDGSAPCVTISAAEVDFGDVLIGYNPIQVLEIINSSSMPQTVTVKVTSPFSIAYNESSMSSQTIEVPGNSCSPVSIMFTAYSEGDYQGTATFTSNAIEGGSIVVPLHGRAVTENPGNTVLSVIPDEIDFGTVPAGTTHVKTISLINNTASVKKVTATVDATFNSFAFSQGQNYVSNLTIDVPAMGCSYVTVLFMETLPGDYSGTVIFQSDAFEDGECYVPLHGQAVDGQGLPIISVNPSRIDFSVPVGQSMTEHLTVSNVGDGILRFFVSETQGPQLTIPESGQEFSLNVGESKVFDVICTPLGSGVSYGSVVRIYSNAENGTQGVAISATGVEPGQHEYVDLGLPSGTLWATMNVGANSPEEYGDYFAWGETEPKVVYDWSTYKWCNGSYNTMTKYCTYSGEGYNGFTDGKTELDPEDDAAYVNWGPSWCMPSMEQQRELVEQCTWTWTTRNGVNGSLFTGPNGNTIFLPDAYGRWGGEEYPHNICIYWSRTLYSSPYAAYCLVFASWGSPGWNTGTGRCPGHAVRAVRVSQN